MARNEEAPGAGTPRASGNEINVEEEIVMANHSTTAAYVTPESVPAMAYAGRPVVTTALLALLYGAKVKQIQNNFGRNQDRFESGKHFFKVEGAELVSLRPSFGGAQIPAKARSLILWTERGAARHAKMLETNEAWDVFEKLEDCYFGKSEAAKALPAPANQTLIGTTIGTDGFHCLAAVLDGKLRLLKGGAKRAAKNHIWQQVHRAFSVVRAEDIPAEQLDSARNFIASYSVKEGEWLQKEEKKGGIYLDDYETHHLYLLMSRFAIMSDHRGNMLAAARALDSKPLWTIFGQIDEGRASFSSLDKRRDEIYSIYCKGGLRGGYAMTA